MKFNLEDNFSNGSFFLRKRWVSNGSEKMKLKRNDLKGRRATYKLEDTFTFKLFYVVVYLPSQIVKPLIESIEDKEILRGN